MSDFAVRSSANELDIAGADSQGMVRARLHLRTGMVTPEDWNTPTSGRELSLEINGQAYPPFVSGGLAPLTLPLTSDAYVNTLVLDPFVAPILSRWGIAFEEPVRADGPEAGYSQCFSDAVSFQTPCMMSGVDYGALSMCYDYFGTYDTQHSLWYQKVVCNDPAHSRAERLCVYPAMAGASTVCGLTGPLGCVVCNRVGNGGGVACLSDSCSFVQTGGGGNCSSQCYAGLCYSDDDCCGCGGYCGPGGECVY